MKAEELMIGNWVHSSIDGDMQMRLDLMEYMEFFEPIPLTEEWLEKFGFKKIDEEEWSLADLQVSRNVLRNIFVWHPYIDVKYVHQLQNLYYALTGEQLKIN